MNGRKLGASWSKIKVYETYLEAAILIQTQLIYLLLVIF